MVLTLKDKKMILFSIIMLVDLLVAGRQMPDGFLRRVVLTRNAGETSFGFDCVAPRSTDSHSAGQYVCGPQHHTLTLPRYLANIRADSPADKASLLAGDYIVKIGSHDVSGASIDVVAMRIREAGDVLHMTVESAALKIIIAGSKLCKIRDTVLPRKYRLSVDHVKIRWASRHRAKAQAYYRVADIKEVRCVLHGACMT